MKATYNKAVLAARGIIRQVALQDGVAYAEVYEGFENMIRQELASTEPQTVRFWQDVKQMARKDVPTPEDLLVYISAMSGKMPRRQFPARIAELLPS